MLILLNMGLFCFASPAVNTETCHSSKLPQSKNSFFAVNSNLHIEANTYIVVTQTDVVVLKQDITGKGIFLIRGSANVGLDAGNNSISNLKIKNTNLNLLSVAVIDGRLEICFDAHVTLNDYDLILNPNSVLVTHNSGVIENSRGRLMPLNIQSQPLATTAPNYNIGTDFSPLISIQLINPITENNILTGETISHYIPPTISFPTPPPR